MKETLTWSETVACGLYGHHEVIFSLSLWHGVSIVLNPCDHIPAELRAANLNLCNSEALSTDKNLALQELWFNPSVTRSRHFTPRVFKRISELVQSSCDIASDILCASGCPDCVVAVHSADPPTAWSGLVLGGDELARASAFDAVCKWCLSASPMIRLLALTWMLRYGREEIAKDINVSNIVRSLSLGVVEKSVAAQAIREMTGAGSKELLYWLIDNFRNEQNEESLAFQRIKSSIASIRKRFGEERALQESLTGLALANRNSRLDHKCWFSVLSCQECADPATLLQFADKQPLSTKLAIAYVLSSEQYLGRYTSSTIRALSEYPCVAEFIGPGLSQVLEDVDLDSKDGRELVELASSSDVPCIRDVAMQLLHESC